MDAVAEPIKWFDTYQLEVLMTSDAYSVYMQLGVKANHGHY